MKIIRFNKDKTLEWDNFVSQAKNGLFLFNRSYMDYHQERFVDHSLMIYRKSKLIAIFPANQTNKSIHSHQGLTFGGLVMSLEIKATDTLNIFTEIINYYRTHLIEQIYYKAISHIFQKYPAQEDLYALFRYKAHIYRRDISSIIQLSNKLRFSETKRQAISKFGLKEVIIIENDDFREYWSLLTKVLSKFNTSPVHTLEEIQLLKSHFPEKIKLFELRIEKELLAGIVIYDYDTVIHTQYMANSNQGREMGALDFINYHLISNVFKDRKYFSFGISTEHDGGVLNEGLIQQKEMMGGRAVVNDFYLLQIEYN